MKLTIKIGEEGQIHIIGDKESKNGGTLHLEQWAGNAIVIKTSPTGEIVKSARGKTIQDFSMDFPELLGLESRQLVHGDIEIETTTNGKIKELRCGY